LLWGLLTLAVLIPPLLLLANEELQCRDLPPRDYRGYQDECIGLNPCPTQMCIVIDNNRPETQTDNGMFCLSCEDQYYCGCAGDPILFWIAPGGCGTDPLAVDPCYCRYSETSWTQFPFEHCYPD